MFCLKSRWDPDDVLKNSYSNFEINLLFSFQITLALYFPFLNVQSGGY